MERQHGEQYRLFYNHAPHTVREVHIAFAEDKVRAARPHLDGGNQQGFDATVQQEARKLWRLLASEGKLELVLQLARVTPGAKLDRQQIGEVLATTRHHVPLQALLVGRILWRICPQDTYTRQLVARHLTDCLGQLKAWEIANIKEARDWK